MLCSLLGRILLTALFFTLISAVGPSASVEAQSLPAPAKLPAFKQLPVNLNLPDVLLMRNGKPVENKEQWEKLRRPELKTLFQHYMYGYMPEKPKEVRAIVEREDHPLFGGKATARQVTLRIGPEGVPPIHLLVVVPSKRSGPVPVFLGITFAGNHAVVADPTIPLSDVWQYPSEKGVVNNRATEASRGAQVDVWNIEQSIDRGYAVATFYNGDVDPDKNDFTDGIHPHYLRPGKKERDPNDWGTIAAWAWGIQRAVDYLLTDSRIDPRRIAVVGHSRNGKAALLAAAFDERIALVIPHQAGCGGTAPSRSTAGETVKQINDHFPHWFNARFKEFNELPAKLPFDQHCLVALMAPRSVLLSNAEEDAWANPPGQFEMLRNADPVYQLYGVEPIQVDRMPSTGKLLDGVLGFYRRPGVHSMTKQDWQAFLDFADRHFRVGSAPK